MKDVLKQIDFGQLTDPIETPKQREAFCGRVVVAKPVIENLVMRMMRELGRDYFGNVMSLEQLAQLNGAIQFANLLLNQVAMFESEHIGKREEEKEKDKTISSGSNLEL